MVKIKAIQVRLTRKQYEQLKHNAELKGFSSLSSYIRFSALHHDFSLYRKVAELHQHVIQPKRKRKQNLEESLIT